MKYFKYKGKYAAWRPGDNKEPVHVHITDARYNSYGKFWISNQQNAVILEENNAYGEGELGNFASELVNYIPQIIQDWTNSTASSYVPMTYIDAGGPVNKPYFY